MKQATNHLNRSLSEILNFCPYNFFKYCWQLLSIKSTSNLWNKNRGSQTHLVLLQKSFKTLLYLTKINRYIKHYKIQNYDRCAQRILSVRHSIYLNDLQFDPLRQRSRSRKKNKEKKETGKVRSQALQGIAADLLGLQVNEPRPELQIQSLLDIKKKVRSIL